MDWRSGYLVGDSHRVVSGGRCGDCVHEEDWRVSDFGEGQSSVRVRCLLLRLFRVQYYNKSIDKKSGRREKT